MEKCLLLVVVLAGVAVLAADGVEVCCEDLGCYDTGGDFFHLVYRSFKLHLNTRSNPNATTVIDPYTPPSIVSSGFQFDKNTKIIVHGFTDYYAWNWWTDVKTAYLTEADLNVIRVEWSHASTPPFLQAAANAQLLGSYIAKFINQLKYDYGYSPSRVHLIGHGLGAHVVGYAGAQVATVGRITGIGTPAGMYFAHMPESVRLDPTDAALVDTIITDAGSILHRAFGSSQAMGHLNFFVNGGTNQPGCDQSLLATVVGGPSSFDTSCFGTAAMIAQTGYQAVVCSHYRALALFTETIRSDKCGLTMHGCSSYEHFQQGKCFDCTNGGCSKMGEHLDTTILDPFQQKNFYGYTTDRPSYCTQTYRLKYKLQATSAATFNESREEHGSVFLTLRGSEGNTSRIELTADEIELKPGQEYGFLFHSPQSLGMIMSVEFYWNARFSMLNTPHWIRRRFLLIDGNLEITSEKSDRQFRLPLSKVEMGRSVRAYPDFGKFRSFLKG